MKQINLLDPLPYEETEVIAPEEMEVKDSVDITDFNIELDDDGQITLSLE